MSLLVLSHSDVEKVVASFTPLELETLLARVFSVLSSPQKASPAYHNPQRLSLPMANHISLFMPARLAEDSLSGTTVKVVSVPQSPHDRGGLPGSTLVLDDATGAVKAIINSRNLTALRNAAGSLLSTNLANIKRITHICAFGAGKQIEAHLRLFLKAYPTIESVSIIVRAYSTRSRDLEATLRKEFPNVKSIWSFASESNEDPEDQESIKLTLNIASVVICATSSSKPLFDSQLLKPGTHIILVGSYKPGMREVDVDLIKRASTLMVDSWEACSVEAGELLDAGTKESEVVEIGKMVSFTKDGELQRKKIESLERGGDGGFWNTGPVTIFKSVGIGLQDVAIACAVLEKAEQMKVGSQIRGYDNQHS